jgi:hypothetical protein
LAIERIVITVDVLLDAVVDRGLDRQRLGFKLRELKSVVLELDQRPAERSSLLRVRIVSSTALSAAPAHDEAIISPSRGSCSINW